MLLSRMVLRKSRGQRMTNHMYHSTVVLFHAEEPYRHVFRHNRELGGLHDLYAVTRFHLASWVVCIFLCWQIQSFFQENSGLMERCCDDVSCQPFLVTGYIDFDIILGVFFPSGK
jgi:hypothetical protein